MSRREAFINSARIAGYHNDSRTFTRLIIEARVNRATMNEAWTYGVRARKAGLKCHCRDCNPLKAEGGAA